MERKKKPNGLLISGLISALASLALVAVGPGFAGGPPERAKSEKTEEASSSNGSDDTKGNDRKSGYEDNSKTPHETNHGRGADNDGDADSDPNTTTEDDHDTADAGDNAHPSGKDRSVENGGSGNQGKSESNPDDSKGPMRYEGAQGDDKPGGPGGTDLADQDGNNGCGNDDDFNDDNNGWCGPRVKPDTTTRTCPDGSTMPASGKCNEVAGGVISKPTCPDGSVMAEGGNCGEGVPCPDGTEMNADGNCDEVLGGTIDRDENPGKPEVEAAAEEAPSVLGVRLSPALNKPVKVAGAVLPFTGGDVLLFLALAIALFACGVVILKATRFGSNHG